MDSPGSLTWRGRLNHGDRFRQVPTSGGFRPSRVERQAETVPDGVYVPPVGSIQALWPLYLSRFSVAALHLREEPPIEPSSLLVSDSSPMSGIILLRADPSALFRADALLVAQQYLLRLLGRRRTGCLGIRGCWKVAATTCRDQNDQQCGDRRQYV